MKFGLFGINVDACAEPATAVRVAQAAEAAGLESLWTADHVVLPDPKTPQSPRDPRAPMLDTVVGLTLVAAHTTTIRVASGIIILPQRNPLVLAKQLASIDQVSGGRLIVGVGAGYLEPEFAALGVSMRDRGRRMDDSIRAMRALWSMEHPQHHGEFVSFSGIDAHPRPVQQPSPPIVVGGFSAAAMRRAVTMGNGWYGFGIDLDQAIGALAGLKDAASQCSRPAELGELEITVTPVGPLGAAEVEAFAAAGVHRLVALPKAARGRDDRHATTGLDDLLRRVDDIGALAQAHPVG